MAQSIKKLFSDSVIYGLSSIVGRFLNYLLVPLYTYRITASSGGYGQITNIYAYTALLLVILTFGMETTFFYFANRQGANARQVFSTAACSVGMVSMFFALSVIIFIHPIASALGYESHPEYLRIMAVVVALDAFQSIFFAWLRYEGRAWKFAFLKLFFIITNIGLNLFVFLVAPRWSASGVAIVGWYRPEHLVRYVFLINLICTATVTLGFIPELKNLRFGIDHGLLRSMLRYTWPLLLLGIVGILNQVADKICFRFLVPGHEGDVQLGIYGACVKIAMIMAMITQAFRYAYEPFVFGNSRDSKSKESQAQVMRYFVIFTLLAYLTVVCTMEILKHIIQRQYWEGLDVVPIVMLAEIFMGIYFNLSFWYKLTEKTWWGAIMSGIGCAVMLSVNILFVPRYGYRACAWGGFAGYAVCMVLSYCIGQRHYRIPYAVGPLTIYFGAALLLASAARAIHIDNDWICTIVRCTLILPYLAVVAVMERDTLKGVSKRLFRRTA